MVSDAQWPWENKGILSWLADFKGLRGTLTQKKRRTKKAWQEARQSSTPMPKPFLEAKTRLEAYVSWLGFRGCRAGAKTLRVMREDYDELTQYNEFACDAGPLF